MLPALDYAPGTELCSRHWTMLPALDYAPALNYAPSTGLCSRHWTMLPALDYAPGTAWTMLPALDYAPGTGLCSRHWTMLVYVVYMHTKNEGGVQGNSNFTRENIDSNIYFMCNRSSKTIWSGIFRHTIKKFTTKKHNYNVKYIQR